jgi:CheY-like chemotaxis protein
LADGLDVDAIAPPEDEEAVNDSLAGVRILLVEDERMTRESLRRLLGLTGAEVTAVGDASAALAELQNGGPPDIIISDIGLPEMDGYQFMQRVRAHELDVGMPPTPALALTAFGAPNDRRQARESGFHEHLAKPVGPSELKSTLVRLLGKRG